MDLALKKRITTNAVQLFTQHGIKSITMDHIATQCGISKRTLYEQFKDKSELVKECITYTYTKNREEEMEIVKHCNNTIELLLNIFKLNIEKLGRTNRNYFIDLQRYHPMIAEMHKEASTQHYKEIVALLKVGMQEGLIRSDLNVELISSLFSLQLKLIIESNGTVMQQYTLSEIFKTVVINFTRGIATQEGIAMIDEFTYSHLPKSSSDERF